MLRAEEIMQQLLFFPLYNPVCFLPPHFMPLERRWTGVGSFCVL
jgi:hypothetical protein